MKKKGLIISTVVMVVVLIASLTTATYAWFTVSNKTTIEGFNVSVVAGNAVNIGVKKNNTHKAGAINDDFLSGTVTWKAGTAGALGKDAGSWEDGAPGLTATLTHGIVWGEQSKAVGAVNSANNKTPSTTANQYGFIGTGKFNGSTSDTEGKATNPGLGNKTFLNAANASTSSTATLAEVDPAVANMKKGNGDTKTSGDYAYLFLGASPATTLTSNELVLLLNGTNSTGTNVGMLAAIHVAYRITKSDASSEATDADWKEAEFFSCDYKSSLEAQNPDLTPTEKQAYNTAYGKAAPTSKAGVVKIPNLSTAQGAIDQIELIIYIAGSDSDCNDNAKNASGTIEIFFATVSAEATKASEASVNGSNILTITGGDASYTAENTTVTIQGADGNYTKVEGRWENGTFTSTSAVTAEKGKTKVKVKNVSQAEKELTIKA